MNLEALRKKIDELDAELVRVLNDRARMVLEIGKLKQSQGEEVYVPAREQEVLKRVADLNQGPLPEQSLNSIYREIMSASLALERRVAIAYLGPPATFTHMAARQKFGGSIDYLEAETISDVFALVEKRTADYGVVPIENSTDGAVTHTLDEFAGTPLKICSEIYLPISNCLLSKGPREKIKKLYSRPEVFAQCRRWIQEHLSGVELIPTSSTSRAAEIVSRESGSAALAGPLAAELYGLNVLEQDVQDLGGNTTRFLVIGKEYSKMTGNDKTSLLFAVKHRVGALYEALSAFKKSNINMTKIESRPSKTKAWEYYFFVDIEGHADDARVQKALSELTEHCSLMTVLGSYPKAAEMDA